MDNLKLRIINLFKNKQKKIFIITDKNRKILYSEFLENSLSILDYFKKNKFNKRIIIKSPNNYNFLLVHFACLIGGYTCCPIDPSTPKKRLEKIKRIYKTNICIESLDNINFKIKRKISLHNLNLNDTECLIIPGYDKKGELVGLCYKSNNLLCSALDFGNLANFNKRTIINHSLPMFYMAGIVDTFFAPLLKESKIILNPFTILGFEKFWKNLYSNKVNNFFLTPSIINFINKIYYKPEKKIFRYVNNCNSIISTGDFLKLETQKNFFKIFKKKIKNVYGLSELGGPLTFNHSFEENCVGSIKKGITIKLKENKNILIKSKSAMFEKISLRYNEKYNGNSFFLTGDKGFLQKKKLFVTARSHRIIKKGGELISLQFIKNELIKVDNIKKISVKKLIDKFSGENYLLVVKLNDLKNLEITKKKINHLFKYFFKPNELPKEIMFI